MSDYNSAANSPQERISKPWHPSEDLDPPFLENPFVACALAALVVGCIVGVALADRAHSGEMDLYPNN